MQNRWGAEGQEIEAVIRLSFTRLFPHIFGQGDSAPLVQPAGEAYLKGLEAVGEQLASDARFLHQRDPASLSVEDVYTTSSGFFAVGIYRFAHLMWEAGQQKWARLMGAYARERTGIDIHPAACIASPFGIDHGCGVVIGETAVVGKGVLLFHGVTLGATGRENAKEKRHPTLEDHVTVYCNATVLGGDTVVGEGAVIGCGVLVTRSVAPYRVITQNS